MNKARAATALVVLNVVLVLVVLGLAEFGLSFYDVPASVTYSVFPTSKKISVIVDPDVTPGVHGNSRYEVNVLGTRGPLPSASDELRIVAIGGSTTECFVLSLEESWPFRVGQLLEEATKEKTWVGNIARSGRNSRQHYFDAKYVVPQFGHVDIALLMMGVNDLFNRMIQGQEFQAADVVKLDEGGEYIFKALRVGAPQGGWLARRHLVTRTRNALESLALLTPRAQAISTSLNHTLPTYYLYGRAMRAARGETLTTLPPMTEAIEEFERNLRLIISLLRENGTRPVLITQASMWRQNLAAYETSLLWLGSADGWPPSRKGGPYYSVEAMATMLDLYNDTVRRVAQSTGTALIDITKNLPADTTVFYDDVHFNESGSERIAGIVADALLERGLVGQPGAVTKSGAD